MISFESINKPKTYLLFGNVFLVSFLILFNNLKIIPLGFGDFIFFAFLILTFALYRPGWAFLFFIGTIVLENINLFPAESGTNIRPFQFFGALIILAVIVRLISKKLYLEILKPTFFDYLVLLMAFGGFLSAAFSQNKISSLKLSVIFLSFTALYFLVRNYIQNSEDLKKIIPFFLSSSVVVILYGIWQNWAYLHNLTHFEVMPGRPNATFPEPDWLGVFLVLLLSVIYVLIYYVIAIRQLAEKQSQNCRIVSQRLKTPRNDIIIFIFLIFIFILLVLTVSRSAWLGALAVTFIFLFIVWTDLKFRKWQWKKTLYIKLKIIASLTAAILIIYIFHLTNFQLFNRVRSTGTGLQEITVSCAPCVEGKYGEDGCQWKPFPINEKVILSENNMLGDYNCRHISLEDKDQELAKGNYITTAYRQDPNVNIRSEIYRKSWAAIKNNPILGVGWGNIGNVLGNDERGTPLNSSNIFLEMWLGAGLIGFLALIFVLLYTLMVSVKNYFYAADSLQKTVNLFIIISWFSIVIPNLFNAGIFLGIFWVWLAVAQIKTES